MSFLIIANHIAVKCLKSILNMKKSTYNLGSINSPTECYEISNPIGRGKYSEVHEGIDS